MSYLSGCNFIVVCLAKLIDCVLLYLVFFYTVQLRSVNYCFTKEIKLKKTSFVELPFYLRESPSKWFLRATASTVGTAEARISYGISVRLSVCHDPVVYQAQVR